MNNEQIAEVVELSRVEAESNAQQMFISTNKRIDEIISRLVALEKSFEQHRNNFSAHEL